MLLEVVALDFRFRARQQMRMRRYTGSAWRGGFGRALRRAVCVTGLSDCPGCPLEARCAYPYLFETRPSTKGGILSGYDRVPNPFVLTPRWSEGQSLPVGSEVEIRLVLIGRAIAHAGIAKEALSEAGLRGLGPDRGVLDPVSIEATSPPPPGPSPDCVEIELMSPLRLVEAGRLVGPAALRPRHLLISLLRRISLLAELHGPTPLALDYRSLRDRAEAAEFASAVLSWTEWARYSSRQHQLLQMGGLLGSLSLPFRGLEPFWPFLSLAPWVHAGKGATMGLGAMRITPR